MMNTKLLTHCLEVAGRPTTYPGEAAVHLQRAREILIKEGKSFEDLIISNFSSHSAPKPTAFVATAELREEIALLKSEVERQKKKIYLLTDLKDNCSQQNEKLLEENRCLHIEIAEWRARFSKKAAISEEFVPYKVFSDEAEIRYGTNRGCFKWFNDEVGTNWTHKQKWQRSGMVPKKYFEALINLPPPKEKIKLTDKERARLFQEAVALFEIAEKDKSKSKILTIDKMVALIIEKTGLRITDGMIKRYKTNWKHAKAEAAN